MYAIVKTLHIISSTFLFGTGIGSAFYMLFASLQRDPRVIAFVVRYVVIADWIFTTTSIIVQPISGWYLAKLMGFPLTQSWLVWSIILYLIAGACWLPVVWLQLKMRDMAIAATTAQEPLPARYWRYFRIWIALGIPAFAALIFIFYFMVAKPPLPVLSERNSINLCLAVVAVNHVTTHGISPQSTASKSLSLDSKSL